MANAENSPVFLRADNGYDGEQNERCTRASGLFMTSVLPPRCQTLSRFPATA